MLVQFETTHEGIWSTGFSAKIHYTPINPICKDWLNITTRFLTYPDYQTIDCSWVITASIGNTISIQINTFEVDRIINKSTFVLLDQLNNIDVCFYIRLEVIFSQSMMEEVIRTLN